MSVAKMVENDRPLNTYWAFLEGNILSMNIFLFYKRNHWIDVLTEKKKRFLKKLLKCPHLCDVHSTQHTKCIRETFSLVL